MSSFETPADIFTRLSVSDSPKGSSNTFKTHKNISLYLKRRYLIIYNDLNGLFPKGSLTQLWEILAVIHCAPKDLRQVLFELRAGNPNLAKSLSEKSNHAMY